MADSTDRKWTRLVKNASKGCWPYYTHPDFPDKVLDLHGAFNIRWDDGETEVQTITSRKASTLETKGLKPISGTVQYFTRERHKVELIYELHEIDIADEDVIRCVVDAEPQACVNA